MRKTNPTHKVLATSIAALVVSGCVPWGRSNDNINAFAQLSDNETIILDGTLDGCSLAVTTAPMGANTPKNVVKSIGGIDTELRTPKSINDDFKRIQKATRMPWSIAVAYYSHLLVVNGQDPRFEVNVDLLAKVETDLNRVKELVYGTQDKESLFSAFQAMLTETKSPLDIYDVLFHSVVINECFHKAKRTDFSAFELHDGWVQVGPYAVDESIAIPLQQMIDAALLDDVNLAFELSTAGRTAARQIELSIINCPIASHDTVGADRELKVQVVGDIFDRGSKKRSEAGVEIVCDPPTALPGRSEHERGLALDVVEGKNTLTRNSEGFEWLEENAKDFGFYNLPSEPWHWSTTGK